MNKGILLGFFLGWYFCLFFIVDLIINPAIIITLLYLNCGILLAIWFAWFLEIPFKFKNKTKKEAKKNG